MRHKLFTVRYKFHYFVSQQVRFDGRNAVAFNAVYLRRAAKVAADGRLILEVGSAADDMSVDEPVTHRTYQQGSVRADNVDGIKIVRPRLRKNEAK